jgi:Amt family ammonium transporter
MINSGDVAWMLVATALVLVMTMPGLAFFYGGLVHRKNVISMIMMSFCSLCLVSLQWILFGYSLSFGPDHGGVIGGFEWAALRNVGMAPNADYAGAIPHLLFMAFQMMFAVITPALISGALAERMKFSAYLVFILLWATLVYDPIAHWVWAKGGWLKDLGILDFAGGAVVHISSGISALVAALCLGKRNSYGQLARPHNLPFSLLGGALLWFGWFGFNAGSALQANDIAVLAFVTTNTAAAAAGLTWMMIDWKVTGRPSLLGGVTGAVSGLVAITPASGYVGPLSSIVIGIAAGIVCYIAITFIKTRFKYDDSLDAFGVHGCGGVTGALLTGVFADKLLNDGGNNGLFYGNAHLLGVQLFGVVVVIAYSAVMTYLLIKLVDWAIGCRVNDEDEKVGLDLTQHEESAYTLMD